MKSATKTIALVSLVFLSACAGPQKTSFPPYMPAKAGVSIEKDISLYSRAVEKLGVKLANELNKLRESYDSEKKSFFIYNADAHEGEERKLSRRFIEDLSSFLVNKRIKLKRKDLVTWDRATKSGESFKVECQEVLENLASDFFIEFSLKECPESADCMEAEVRVIARESNAIVFTAKESFSLTGNVANWYHQKHKLSRVKGSRKNPYSDYREAANYMVGRLSCIAKSMMPDDTMHILVAKTKTTPSEVATAFSETVSFYGLEQVIVSEWLPVAIRAGDQFELGIYRREHRELFETADLVLALDMKNAENGKLFLKAHLLAIRSINIIKDGKNKTLGAGMALPFCVCSGYASSYSSDNHTSLSDTTPVKSIEKKVSQPSNRQVQSTQRTGNASASYQRAQSAMLRDLENNLRDRLKKDGISPAVVNLIFITGSLDLPDCRKENHYLSPEGVPSRHYCSLNYDLKLVMRDKELFCCQSRVRGMGSNRNTAWEDALLGVVDNLYPLVSDVALAVSEKKTLKDLRKTLLSLDESLWQVSDNFDMDSVLDFVERQIEDLR